MIHPKKHINRNFVSCRIDLEKTRNCSGYAHIMGVQKKKNIPIFLSMCPIYGNKWNIHIKALEFDSNFIAKPLLCAVCACMCFNNNASWSWRKTYTIYLKRLMTLKAIFIFNLDRNVAVLLEKKPTHTLTYHSLDKHSMGSMEKRMRGGHGINATNEQIQLLLL